MVSAIDKQKMIDIYKKYGYDMPMKAKYKRNQSRVYFPNDFKDGEEIAFFWNCEKTNACAKGYAFYIGITGVQKVINIKELELIK